MSVVLYIFWVISVFGLMSCLHDTVAYSCTEDKMLSKCLRWHLLDRVLALLVISCKCLAGTLQMCWSVSRGIKLG